MKVVKVKYIESGSFRGGEEDVYNAGIEYNEECVVLRKKSYEHLNKLIMSLKKELNMAAENLQLKLAIARHLKGHKVIPKEFELFDSSDEIRIAKNE